MTPSGAESWQRGDLGGWCSDLGECSVALDARPAVNHGIVNYCENRSILDRMGLKNTKSIDCNYNSPSIMMDLDMTTVAI